MHAGERISADDFAEIRRRAIFECCKWDPQTEDVGVLANYPLLLSQREWLEISTAAEDLASELLAAEHELATRPLLVKRLGLPRAVVRLIDGRRELSIAGPRVMRFDFHWTTDGWLISEVNCDVPGGFIEGGGFSALVAGAATELQATGDPACAYVDAICYAVPANARVALVHATAYVDDRQVMIYLARKLAARGLRPLLVSPANLVWQSGKALASDNGQLAPVDLIVRFFPAEWLPQLSRRSQWHHFFVEGHTPQSNSGFSLAMQSKRLPLVWDELETPLARWRSLLPETRDPRRVRWQRDESWILKSSLGRVGDGVGLRGVTVEKDWKTLARAARWRPSFFAAQRRFTAIPIATPDGPRFPAIGVFTIDGRASGIYARVARQPLVDHSAQDVAVLMPTPTTNSNHTSTGTRDVVRVSL